MQFLLDVLEHNGEPCEVGQCLPENITADASGKHLMPSCRQQTESIRYFPEGIIFDIFLSVWPKHESYRTPFGFFTLTHCVQKTFRTKIT